MKKLVLSLCMTFVLTLLVQPVDAQLQKTTSNDAAGTVGIQTDQNRLQDITTTLQKDSWEPLFGDEFNGPDFDENSYWNPDGIWLCGQIHGNELQYYTRYNKDFPAVCDKGGNNHDMTTTPGSLKLLVKEEPGEYEVWFYNPFSTKCIPYDYTSGWINSLQKFRYGYFEIRCKIPNRGLVLWPAFWLWGADENCYGEIDIAECMDCGYLPENCQPNKVGMNLHVHEDILQACHWTDTLNNPVVPFINCYYGEYIVTGSPDITESFHTYAVRWMPNSVIWFVDGQPVHMIADGHVPTTRMELVANLAISKNCPPDNNACNIVLNDFPYNFEIDYIRVSRSLNKEFLWEWGNGGAGCIPLVYGQIHYPWTMNQNDKYILGDFVGNGRDQMLAVDPVDQAMLMQYTGTDYWELLWHNQNQPGYIGPWLMHSDDKYLAGDFEGDGKTELIALANTAINKVLKYSAGNWNSLPFPTLDPAGNRFFVGNFNGDGHDELLVIGTDNLWARVMEFSVSGWNSSWDNSGSGQIALWYIHSGDKYTVGDFNGDGKDEVLAIADNGWSHLMEYSGGNWQWLWGNDGSGQIAWWYIHPGDKYMVGDFNSDGKDEVLAIGNNGWSHLMEYSGGNWQWVWGNDGGNTIHLWHMASDDIYMSGQLDNQGHDKLLALSRTGWVHVIDYQLMKGTKSSPVIVPIAPAVNAKAGKNLHFTVRAIDPDNALLHPTLSVMGMPSSATFFVNMADGTGMFSWTPTVADFGHHIVTFFASDSGGVDSTQTDIKVSICGDANGDGNVNVADAVFIVNYIFRSGPAPDPVEAGDVNGNGAVTVADAVYLVNYVFRGGPEPYCP